MNDYEQYRETLDLCTGAQNNMNVKGWKTLNQYNNFSTNKEFDYKVYQQGNTIVIALAGTDKTQKNDLKNDGIIFSKKGDKIPSQYGDAQSLYEQIKRDYPNCKIKTTGYSLGATISTLLSLHNGIEANVIAPIGSKHIAKNYSNYFKYDDSLITTYGRIGDQIFKYFLDSDTQSGKIIILPDSKNKNDKRIIHNHYLDTYNYDDIKYAKIYRNSQKQGYSTGYASNIEDFDHIFTRAELAKMSRQEFIKYEHIIEEQIRNGTFYQNMIPDYSDFINEISGENRIFTREDLGSMTLAEFSKNEPAIRFQMNTIGIPTIKEITKSTGIIYIEAYRRGDGTYVKSHYRSKPKSNV